MRSTNHRICFGAEAQNECGETRGDSKYDRVGFVAYGLICRVMLVATKGDAKMANPTAAPSTLFLASIRAEADIS
jgi:hypothetical protein